MKNLKYIFTILLLGLNVTPAFAAATPTPTPSKSLSPTISQTLNEKLDSQINQLKDKIASRVTELNLVEKRGIIGIVSDASANQITLTDIQGVSRQIDVDEITKFSSPSNNSFGFSDLTKGTKISVLGLYNKQSKRILARFVNVSVDPVFLSGAIFDLDSKNFTFHIVSSDQKKTNIDIESPTKIFSYIKDSPLTKIIFSKLNIADRVFVIGYPDKKDPTLIVASRIIDLPDAPKDPKINITTPTPIVTATPTIASSSAKKALPTIAK